MSGSSRNNHRAGQNAHANRQKQAPIPGGKIPVNPGGDSKDLVVISENRNLMVNISDWSYHAYSTIVMTNTSSISAIIISDDLCCRC